MVKSYQCPTCAHRTTAPENTVICCCKYCCRAMDEIKEVERVKTNDEILKDTKKVRAGKSISFEEYMQNKAEGAERFK